MTSEAYDFFLRNFEGIHHLLFVYCEKISIIIIDFSKLDQLVYPRTYRLSMLCLISLLAGISEMDRLINMFCLISLA
nr:hypothetical protein [Tanacetum cinerariifolium]